MKTASIEILSNLTPHPNADRLELARVLGWQCVVKKGEFKEGDRVVFIPPDTILPKAPWSDFLADKNRPDRPIRLKTAKLRGQFSQGLVLPLSVLPEASQTWGEGSDVGAELGVKKFEKELPAQLSGTPRANFPASLAARTDEDNYQSVPDQTRSILGQDFYVTRKLDGSSCTIIIENGAVTHVCSRNIDLAEDPNNAFWKVATELRDRAAALGSCVLQGELMGPGVQGNQLGLTEPVLFLFQVRWLGDGTYADWEEIEEVATHLDIPTAPLLQRFRADTTRAESLQAFADQLTLPNGKPCEGIVIRPVKPVSMGNGRPLSVKIVNRNYGE